MPDTSVPLTSEFFINPRCPPSSSSVLTIEENSPTKSLPIAGVDIPSGPSARLDEEPNVADEG